MIGIVHSVSVSVSVSVDVGVGVDVGAVVNNVDGYVNDV